VHATTITVTNTNDSGPGSLRQAILVDASPGDTINFAPSVTTVNLTSGELVIDRNLTITGPGANRLTVQRSTNAFDFRIFHIRSSTVTVSISGITISNGRFDECSGSIFGTAISQTRNKFDPDNFNHCVLIVTASAVYFTIKIRGMADA
jgi:hypothetical protein